MGYEALKSSTTGTRNIAIGYGALDEPDTESQPRDWVRCFGWGSCWRRVCTIGNYALDALTAGDDNVGIGQVRCLLSLLEIATLPLKKLSKTKQLLITTLLSVDGQEMRSLREETMLSLVTMPISTAQRANQIVIGSGAVGTAHNTVS